MIQNKKHQNSLIPTHSRAIAKRNADSTDGSLLGISLKSSLFATLGGIACAIVLISAASAVAYGLPDPAPLIAPLGIAALMPSMFTCGFIAAKKVKEAPMLCGIVSGGVMTLVTIIAGVIFKGLPTSNYAFWQSACLHGASILFSILGAFAGNVKRKQKRKKHRFGN